jgi:DNA-binding NarL/FixJ family response regulator
MVTDRTSESWYEISINTPVSHVPRDVASFPPRWLLEATNRLETLTDRQLAVMELLSRGMANSEIARELSCSERTVKQHLSAIFTRLDICSRLQAGLIAYHSKLGKAVSDWSASLSQDP